MPEKPKYCYFTVSVEGGGQHTVVVKTEPGLEDETGSNNTEKQQSQVGSFNSTNFESAYHACQ